MSRRRLGLAQVRNRQNQPLTNGRLIELLQRFPLTHLVLLPEGFHSGDNVRATEVLDESGENNHVLRIDCD